MIKLNSDNVKVFADYLCFTEDDAKEITDLFYTLKAENPNNNWKVCLPLNDTDDYIREWENHWHREAGWEDYYKYEKENCIYCYGENDEVLNKIFESLETFKEEVKSCSYELKSGTIIIVG